MSRSKPIHPGEVLELVYMKAADPPLRLDEFAGTLRMSRKKLRAFLKGQGRVTLSLASRLSAACHTTMKYWIGLQALYDRSIAAEAKLRDAGRDAA